MNDIFLAVDDIESPGQPVGRRAHHAPLQVIDTGVGVTGSSGRLNTVCNHLGHACSGDAQIVVAIGRNGEVGHLLTIVPVVEDKVVGTTLSIEQEDLVDLVVDGHLVYPAM